MLGEESRLTEVRGQDRFITSIAAKRGEETEAHGRKSFFYSTGLAEGTETVVIFALMALVPAWFVPLAWGYAALCVLTVIQRSALAWITFR